MVLQPQKEPNVPVNQFPSVNMAFYNPALMALFEREEAQGEWQQAAGHYDKANRAQKKVSPVDFKVSSQWLHA